jgi:hypothetical protein
LPVFAPPPLLPLPRQMRYTVNLTQLCRGREVDLRRGWGGLRRPTPSLDPPPLSARRAVHGVHHEPRGGKGGEAECSALAMPAGC